MVYNENDSVQQGDTELVHTYVHIVYVHIVHMYDCWVGGMKPHVCGMARIVALAINLRHSQRGGKKKLCKCGKRSGERDGKSFFSFSHPFTFCWVLGL